MIELVSIGFIAFFIGCIVGIVIMSFMVRGMNDKHKNNDGNDLDKK